MKNPQEQELIDEIELEKKIIEELTLALEESDKRLRMLKNKLVEMRMRPIIVGS